MNAARPTRLAMNAALPQTPGPLGWLCMPPYYTLPAHSAASASMPTLSSSVKPSKTSARKSYAARGGSCAVDVRLVSVRRAQCNERCVHGPGACLHSLRHRSLRHRRAISCGAGHPRHGRLHGKPRFSTMVKRCGPSTRLCDAPVPTPPPQRAPPPPPPQRAPPPRRAPPPQKRAPQQRAPQQRGPQQRAPPPQQRAHRPYAPH